MKINKSIYMNQVGIGILINSWGYLLFSEKIGKNTLCIFSHFPRIIFIRMRQTEVEDNFVW